MEPTTVANVEARWMRVRLVSGGFGFRQQVTWHDEKANQNNTLTYVVSRPPALSVFKLGYSWTFGPFAPEHVLTYNDFQYQDRTDAAVWPGQVFRPFTPPADITPALYLGFDKSLPVDELGIFFDIVEDRTDTLGPALVWEYWDGGAWRGLRVDDETRRLRMPGLVGLIGPEDSEALARFGTSRWWLRVRLQEDGPPGAPTVRGVFPNATWAVQHQTVVDDPIGASTGLPDQAMAFRQAPVLAGEQIDVRELAGPRANVEWRIVARELYAALHDAISEIEARLGREGADPKVEYGRLRLQRDRNKQVTEVWVRWELRDTLARSRPNDRHYLLERTRGGLRFGDGTEGKVPPAGAAIVARRYQTGGGSVGNVPAGAIAQLQGAVAGVQSVQNPVAAEGGADAETLDALRVRVRSRCGIAVARSRESILRRSRARRRRPSRCRRRSRRAPPTGTTVPAPRPSSSSPRRPTRVPGRRSGCASRCARVRRSARVCRPRSAGEHRRHRAELPRCRRRRHDRPARRERRGCGADECT